MGVCLWGLLGTCVTLGSPDLNRLFQMQQRFYDDFAGLPRREMTLLEAQTSGGGLLVRYANDVALLSLHLFQGPAEAGIEGVQAPLIRRQFDYCVRRYFLEDAGARSREVGFPVPGSLDDVRLVFRDRVERLGGYEFLSAELRYTDKGHRYVEHVYLRRHAGFYWVITLGYPEALSAEGETVRLALLREAKALLR